MHFIINRLPGPHGIFSQSLVEKSGLVNIAAPLLPDGSLMISLNEEFFELRIALLGLVVPDGNGERFFRADEDDKFFPPRNGSIEKVPLEQQIMLRQDRHDDHGIFAAL